MVNTMREKNKMVVYLPDNCDQNDHKIPFISIHTFRKMPLSTRELKELSKSPLVKRFIRVFPTDKHPAYWCYNNGKYNYAIRFIMNMDPSNRPGQRWLIIMLEVKRSRKKKTPVKYSSIEFLIHGQKVCPTILTL